LPGFMITVFSVAAAGGRESYFPGQIVDTPVVGKLFCT